VQVRSAERPAHRQTVDPPDAHQARSQGMDARIEDVRSCLDPGAQFDRKRDSTELSQTVASVMMSTSAMIANFSGRAFCCCCARDNRVRPEVGSVVRVCPILQGRARTTDGVHRLFDHRVQTHPVRGSR